MVAEGTTTGYIIPTLFNSLDVLPEEIVEERTIDAAEWLLGIQNENGGWQGGRVNENKPAVVFNTGQVIRGMLTVYKKTGKEQYLNAARRAGDWLCEIQHKNGYWKKNALMRQARVYDSYVDAPLIYLSEVSGDVKYKKYAIRNLNWIVDLKQLENGWFEDCDNTIKRNDQPILHTIAYTIDGLLDSGMALHDDKYIKSACIPTDVLLHKFIENNYLNNRFDKDWKGSEYMMNTGCAQIAIVWLKLAALKNNREYFDAAAKMIDLLIYIQNRGKYDNTDTRGALPGSFPIWGKYEPFAFPNWATKYFCDSLILENKTRKIFHAE